MKHQSFTVLHAMYTGEAWSGRRAMLADPLAVAACYAHGANGQ